MKGSFVDGGLVDQASAGNRESLQALCRFLAEGLRAGDKIDPYSLAFLADALARIGAGESPDSAFGFGQARRGRRPGNHALRDWCLRKSVQDRLRAGESLADACFSESVGGGGEFDLSPEHVARICRGLTAGADLPLPESVFPVA